MKKQIILSLAWLFAAGIVESAINPIATIGASTVAAKQFDNSDTSAIVASVGINAFHGLGGIVSLATIAILFLIWFPVVKEKLMPLLKCLLIASLVGIATPANAYFDSTDKTEAITIMPNESAFWIPDTGANKNSQASLDSLDYLAANKVAMKRFVIPHQKLSGSGGFGSWDSYVPTGRMILVDRSPYNREWTKENDRGTSSKDQSFPCQTYDGLNVTAEVSIAASVSEENAANFLYHFGVNNPKGDRTQPDVIFTSVYYGRSLEQVMDGIGRGLVQTAVCREIGGRNFETANKDYNLIMDNVQKTAAKFFSDRGITLDYIGWSGTFSFDKDVQQAINDNYTGQKVASVLPALQTKAQVDAMEGWDHHLPTSVSFSWWPSNFGDALSSLFGKKAAAVQ